MKTIVSLL